MNNVINILHAGSLRKGSYNRGLLRRLRELVPPDAKIDILTSLVSSRLPRTLKSRRPKT